MPPIRKMRPIHPGEILREEYLRPLRLSAHAFALAIGVPANRVSLILNGERAVTADTACRLAAALRTTPQFWLNLQNAYDLALAAPTVARARIRPVHDVADVDAG